MPRFEKFKEKTVVTLMCFRSLKNIYFPILHDTNCNTKLLISKTLYWVFELFLTVLIFIVYD